MHVGLGELIVVGFVCLVVFSASRMSALGNAVGKFVHSYRQASKGQGFVDVRPLPAPPEDAAVVDPDHSP